MSERDIAERRVTPGFRALLAREVARARELFAATARLPDALHPGVRPGIVLACSVYMRVLDRVESLGLRRAPPASALPPWRFGAARAADADGDRRVTGARHRPRSGPGLAGRDRASTC